jgi:hypothetical protein
VDATGSFLEGEELEDGATVEVGVEHAASVVRGEEESPPREVAKRVNLEEDSRR